MPPLHRIVIGFTVLFALAGALAAARGTLQRPGQRAAARGGQDFRSEGALRPGDLAPDFTLEPRGGGPAATLSAFRGRSPVALVFGSYT